MFKPGMAVVPSNSLGTAPDAAVTPNGIEVSFDRGANRNRQTTVAILLTNMEAAAGNTLEISFSNGRTWFAVAPNTTIQIPVIIHHVRLRGTSGGTTDYSIMGIIA